MFRVRFLFVLGIDSTCSFNSVVLRVLNAAESVLLSNESPIGWSVCSRLFSGATILAKFGTNRQNSLHSSKKDLVSVRDVSV